MMRRLPLLILLTLSAALALSAPAMASASLQVGIADDGVTQRTPALAPEVIPQWRAKGADVARLLVIWAYVAPDSERMTMPAGFDPTDPNAPGYNWAPIDQAVSLLRQNGIEPILNLTGWAPLWGTKDPSLRDQRLNPDPKQFATFAEAAARRYGSGPTVNDSRCTISSPARTREASTTWCCSAPTACPRTTWPSSSTTHCRASHMWCAATTCCRAPLANVCSRSCSGSPSRRTRTCRS